MCVQLLSFEVKEFAICEEASRSSVIRGLVNTIETIKVRFQTVFLLFEGLPGVSILQHPPHLHDAANF